LGRGFWAQEELQSTFKDVAERLDDFGPSAEGLAEAALGLANLAARGLGLEGAPALLGGRERVGDLYAPVLAQLPELLREASSGLPDDTGARPTEGSASEYAKDVNLLLVQFEGDGLDETPELERRLASASASGVPRGNIKKETLPGTHLTPTYSEPPDLFDGTDAMGRAALSSEAPFDTALLGAGARLDGLVDALDKFLDPASPDVKTAERPPRVVLKGLTANDLRHPLDRRQTKALERIPGIGEAVRRVVSIVEQGIYQDNISSSVLVGEHQYPWLNKLLEHACSVLDIPKEQRPELFVRQNPVPNAYTLAVQSKRPFVVVHTALLELMCEDEVEAVIAHELGHLKCEHGTWLSAANIVLLGASTLPLPVRILGPILDRIQEELMIWQRAAELSCDRAALLVAQEPWVPVSVMVKLSGGGASAPGKEVLPRQQLEAFLQQAQKYDEAKAEAGLIGSMLNMTSQRTHPLPVLRARELRRWADSEQFRRILFDGKASEASP